MFTFYVNYFHSEDQLAYKEWETKAMMDPPNCSSSNSSVKGTTMDWQRQCTAKGR